MSPLGLFLRTAASRRFLLHLLYGVGTAILAGRLATWGSSWIGWGAGVGTGAEATLLIAAFALGSACGGLVVDVLLCPLSWTLPGLRERLRTACLAVGLVVAGALALAHGPLGGVGPGWCAMARGLLFFALGLQLDSFARTYFLGLCAAVVGVVSAGAIASAAAAWPVAVTLVALPAALLLGRLPFGAPRARAKALLPTARIASVFGIPIHRASDQDLEEPEWSWHRGRGSGSTRDWLATIFYDVSGHTPLRWLRLVLFPIALCGVGGAVVVLATGWADAGSFQAGVAAVRDTFLGGSEARHAPMLVLMVGVLIGTVAAFHGVDFASTLTYPLSRDTRAAAVWGASLFQATGVALVGAGAALALGSVAAGIAGGGFPAAAPLGLRALAMAPVAFPVAHALVLWGTDPDPRRGKGPLLIPVGAAALSVLGGAHLWALAVRATGEALPLVGWLALVALVQLLWRGHLHARYARCDLA